jgi:hypothetical protein
MIVLDIRARASAAIELVLASHAEGSGDVVMRSLRTYTRFAERLFSDSICLAVVTLFEDLSIL